MVVWKLMYYWAPVNDAAIYIAMFLQYLVLDVYKRQAVDVPLLARLFQCLIGPHRAFAGSAAHRKLHGHDGQAQNDCLLYTSRCV